MIVDEVRKHWVAFVLPGLEGIAALVLLVASPWLPMDLASVPLIVAFPAGGMRCGGSCASTATGS